MNNSNDELYENYEEIEIGLDDSFRFKCRSCGKCCKNRVDIMLTSRDLYNIAKKFGITMEEAITRYGEPFVGRSSRMPIVRLRPMGPAKACPLLREKRCTVHDCKPVVCALYPLGRIGVAEDPSSPDSMSCKYILQPIECGSLKKTYTVRQWLETYNIPVKDSFYDAWNEAVVFFSQFIHNLEKIKVSESLLNTIANVIFAGLYIRYDMDSDMEDQFLKNTNEIKKALSLIRWLDNQP